MVKAPFADHFRAGAEPGGASCFEQREGAFHIGSNEVARTGNRPVDMAFGREVDDGINAVFIEEPLDQRPVANVAVNERVTALVG